jgi:hypothetical protein
MTVDVLGRNGQVTDNSTATIARDDLGQGGVERLLATMAAEPRHRILCNRTRHATRAGGCLAFTSRRERCLAFAGYARFSRKHNVPRCIFATKLL